MQTETEFETRILQSGIEIYLTNRYELCWNDRGSRTKMDGAFWQPIAPGLGFWPLGTLGLGNYRDPNGKRSVVCVRKREESFQLLTHPRTFRLIWADHGSGADRDGSCWRPLPISSEYVAMGDIFVNGYNPPSQEETWCLHRSLVKPASIGEIIWDTTHSGADRDFSTWCVDDEACPFISNNSHEKPDIEVFSLKMD